VPVSAEGTIGRAGIALEKALGAAAERPPGLAQAGSLAQSSSAGQDASGSPDLDCSRSKHSKGQRAMRSVTHAPRAGISAIDGDHIALR
jgi:hypothetical protein